VDVSHVDDQESADSAPVGLDLTPREAPPRRVAGSRGRRALAIGGIAVVVGALGLVLFNGLTDAAMFYYDVDEALERRDDLEDRRFRMQGNVVEDTTVATDTGIEFVIAYRDAELPVVHRGDPPELFNEEIPIIIEGSFVGDEFHSDEILIKHDSTYEEENDARLREARQDAERRSAEAG
jgi:cytochrome c-type biogenesis protein CcmE